MATSSPTSMSKRLLDIDGFGVANYHHFDNETGLTTITSEADVSAILDFNRRQNNDANRRFGEFTKVASIDPVTWARLKNEGIADDPKALKKWLNDPDNVYFRTHPGTL